MYKRQLPVVPVLPVELVVLLVMLVQVLVPVVLEELLDQVVLLSHQVQMELNLLQTEVLTQVL